MFGHFLQDDVQCGRRTGMSMLANAQNRWERTGKKNKTWRGDFQLEKKPRDFLIYALDLPPHPGCLPVANKGLGWDSLQELSKNPGGFHLNYAGRGGQPCWNDVFHEWFSPRVQTSRFF